MSSVFKITLLMQEWIQDIKLGGGGGGGGAHLKKLRRAEVGAKMFGVFRVKNHDFTPKKKSYFFPFLRGCLPPPPPPPWIRPCNVYINIRLFKAIFTNTVPTNALLY